MPVGSPSYELGDDAGWLYFLGTSYLGKGFLGASRKSFGNLGAWVAITKVGWARIVGRHRAPAGDLGPRMVGRHRVFRVRPWMASAGQWAIGPCWGGLEH